MQDLGRISIIFHQGHIFLHKKFPMILSLEASQTPTPLFDVELTKFDTTYELVTNPTQN
jgi:hypothetical protein